MGAEEGLGNFEVGQREFRVDFLFKGAGEGFGFDGLFHVLVDGVEDVLLPGEHEDSCGGS